MREGFLGTKESEERRTLNKNEILSEGGLLKRGNSISEIWEH